MISLRNHLVWLAPEDDADLLACALCGDELAPPSAGTWFRPGAVSRGAGVMLLRYEGGGGGLGLCVVAAPEVTPVWVSALRADVSVEGAEQRWGPLAAMLGPYQSAAEPAAWVESSVVHEGALWRARHPRHPSAIIDRLSARARAEGEARIRAAFMPIDMVPAARASAGRALH